MTLTDTTSAQQDMLLLNPIIIFLHFKKYQIVIDEEKTSQTILLEYFIIFNLLGVIYLIYAFSLKQFCNLNFFLFGCFGLNPVKKKKKKKNPTMLYFA